MKDKSASIWTRAPGYPLKMGSLTCTETESRFNYDDSFIDKQVAGLSNLYPVELFGNRTIAFQRRQGFDFHPPIQALIPPDNKDNFQRQLALSYLKKKGVNIPVRGIEQDWLLLTTTGHGGIGHIDVFIDDDAANNWYQSSIQHRFFALNDRFGFSLKEFMTWYDAETSAEILSIIGPTPTVGGAIPKILLSIPETGWDRTIGLPTRRQTSGTVDIILKLEKNTAYPGIVDLEALALDLHKEAGFITPEYWIDDIGGIPAIAVSRFDRSTINTPIPLETVYSVLAIASNKVSNNHSVSYEKIADLINSSRINIFSDRKEAKKHLVKRMLLALLTGNGDLHLENLSIMQSAGKNAFSPVYDPTPMRAYSIHNMLTPMPFGQYGEIDEKSPLINAFYRFTNHLGMNKNEVMAILQQIVPVVQTYADRIQQLKRLPDENKQNLINIHRTIFNQFFH